MQHRQRGERGERGERERGERKQLETAVFGRACQLLVAAVEGGWRSAGAPNPPLAATLPPQMVTNPSINNMMVALIMMTMMASMVTMMTVKDCEIWHRIVIKIATLYQMETNPSIANMMRVMMMALMMVAAMTVKDW